MIELLVGVFVGYFFGVVPRFVESFSGRKKNVSPKARQPTEQERREYEKMMREYVNFMSYDGSEQE